MVGSSPFRCATHSGAEGVKSASRAGKKDANNFISTPSEARCAPGGATECAWSTLSGFIAFSHKYNFLHLSYQECRHCRALLPPLRLNLEPTETSAVCGLVGSIFFTKGPQIALNAITARLSTYKFESILMPMSKIWLVWVQRRHLST